MIPFDLHYENPSAVYLLLFVVVLLALFLRLYWHRQKVLQGFVGEGLLFARSPWRYWVQVVVFLMAWIFLVLALMDPVGNGTYPENRFSVSEKEVGVKRKSHDVILLLDSSASMEVPDSRTGDTRLAYAKEIADEVIGQLQGESVAVYAFTSQATQLSPATMDYLFARMRVDGIQVNEGGTSGTDLTEAIREMRDHFFSSPAPKLVTLVLFSDGGDNRLEELPPEKQEALEKGIEQLLGDAEKLHLRIFVVGLGSKEGGVIPGFTERSSLQETILRHVSRRGKYYHANEGSPLEIAEDIRKGMDQDDPFLERSFITKSYLSESNLIYDHFFQYPLGIAIGLILFGLYLPQRKGNLFCLFCLLSFGSLSAQQEREAITYLEAGEEEQARNIWAQMMETNAQDWQQDFLRYNVAVSYMQEREWQKALQELKKISLQQESSPLLRVRVKTNLAYSWLQLADEQGDALYRRAALEEALDEVKQSIDASCALQKTEGIEGCEKDPNLALIEQLVQQKLASLEKVKQELSKEQLLDALIGKQLPKQKREKKESPAVSDVLQNIQKMQAEDRETIQPVQSTVQGRQPW